MATTNPPYTDSADFGPELKEFIEDNYKKPYKFHTNLYASFLKRCCDIVSDEGKIAMIHPNTFMFIKSFEGVRRYILENLYIEVLVDYGLDRVNLFGGDILLDSNSFYVLCKTDKQANSIFFNIALNQQEKYKKISLLQALNDVIERVNNERVSYLSQSKFKIIKSWPFIYWISDDLREKFKGKLAKELLSNCQGLATTDNNRFLRFWWEIVPVLENSSVKDKWYLYAKGGPFKKWDGNLWLMVNFEHGGFQIKESVKKKYPYLKGKTEYVVKNEEFYFQEGITYSASGQKGPSFRILPSGCIFDVGGSSIFPLGKYKNLAYILAFYNSKLTSYILGCLNPTVNVQAGDIERLPFIVPKTKNESIISNLSEANVKIVRRVNKAEVYDINFKPFVFTALGPLTAEIKLFLNTENYLLTQVMIDEAIINEKIFEVYNLTEHDKDMVLAKEGESIGGLPVIPEARDAYLSETEATKDFPLDAIRDFIEALPAREFNAEEREAIESGFPSLFQNNNDLEEFCIRHQVNPINIWYWFKQSNVIPQQRMHTLAMEFLADMIREILMGDEDGIVPIVPNAGETVLLDRIEEKFREKGFSSAQYSSFDTVLGRSIHEYLSKYFFAELSDHLNLFMYLPKTPFIWHLSSGPEQAFDCYIIIYKWSRDKLMRLRSVYIEHRERSLVNRQSDLAGNESAEAQNEKDHIFRQLKEIESFKSKIDELLSEGYNPILDDGVGKNIAPLQKKKMIAYDVLNEGQLKKYLNADW